MGVFANRTHDIISVDNCLIQNKNAEKVAKEVFRFIKDNNISIYDEKSRKRSYKTYNSKNRSKN